MDEFSRFSVKIDDFQCLKVFLGENRVFGKNRFFRIFFRFLNFFFDFFEIRFLGLKGNPSA